MNRKQSRRTLLSGGVAVATEWAVPSSAQLKRVYAYVGCYTTRERHARGDGIHVYEMNPETGAWSHLQHVANLVNPSFLILSADQRFLYSVHGGETYATSFSVDRNTGHLALLNRAQTGGRNGVAHAIDRSGKFMVVANYESGSVAVLPVKSDGTLADEVQLVALEGKPGPHRTEQTSSHPHHVVFDPAGRFVLVPDKGLDRVFVFRFDADTGRLTATEQGSAVARAGSAPRHAAFHPTLPVAWVLNEIASSVTTYSFDGKNGYLRAVEILSTLPADYTGENSGAEIAISGGGKFVYCSNRGHDSVAIFQVDPATGKLTSAGWAPSLGKTPRFIAFDPASRFFFAANEQSDIIVAFRSDRATGQLEPTAQVIHNASPVTIAFAG